MRGVIVSERREPWLWLGQPALIFLFAFILRVAVMGVLVAHNRLSWGVNELGGIARALVEGRGFSGAFHDAAGPTAWFAPAYPALLAVIFRIFGVETSASLIVTILLNCIFASVTAWVLVQLGREQFHETAGAIAGWAWAASPPLLFMPWLPWETCLSGLVFAWAMKMILKLKVTSFLWEWAWCGAIWGFAALVNPVLVAPLPALALCILGRTHRWKGVVVMTLVCTLCVLPWAVRNFRALGLIVPVRTNFWPELYFANADFSLHPLGSSMLYQREGEALFVVEMKGRALNFIRLNPGTFWPLTARRVAEFWSEPRQLWPYPWLLAAMTLGGIIESARQGKPWLECLLVILLYPPVYYITHTFARFRYPIEPLMYALSGYFVYSLYAGWQRRRTLSTKI